MSLPKILTIFTLCLFGTIAFMGWMKKGTDQQIVTTTDPYEIALEPDETYAETLPQKEPEVVEVEIVAAQEEIPEVNRVNELFNVYEPKSPIVETVTYKSKVDWQPGRAAWISDYARHYETSRHFIARSLNGKPEYFKQNVASGDRFNVFRTDKNIEFHLVIDVLSNQMLLYYQDKDANDLVLLKNYTVGLGRPDKARASGSLTPLGRYSLGNKVAIYKPKTYSYHNGERVEMIRTFGTRWIPFDQELGDNTAPSKGFGIHGLPWVEGADGELHEDSSSLGKYESDGCIRLSTDDVEELFSIVITKPTTVHLVKGFQNAKLPGK